MQAEAPQYLELAGRGAVFAYFHRKQSRYAAKICARKEKGKRNGSARG